MALTDDVERVRRATDMVELVESFVPLKRAGASYRALCPFHEEKSPSFHVFPESQIFKCFGCNAAGDCFAFIQKRQGMSFRESLEWLAERAGVELTGRSRESNAPDRRSAYECLEHATQYFENLLLKTPSHFESLDARGLTPTLRKEWRIGLAPQGWQTVHEYLAGKGFGEEIQIAAGIVARSESGRIYDRFRDRITFPITDVLGRVVAFGARLLPGVPEGEKNGPKYLNSPENEFFIKRNILYGLDKVARAPKYTNPSGEVNNNYAGGDAPIVIMEGYTDVILSHSAGLRRSVATLGTALGHDHAKLIKRFSNQVLLLYDGDEAGLRASERGIGILLEEGLRVRVAALPDDLDPADFVMERGPEAFLQQIGNGVEFLEFVASRLAARSRGAGGGTGELARHCDEVLEYVAKIESGVERELWVRKVASWFALSETRVGDRLAKIVSERKVTKTGIDKTTNSTAGSVPYAPGSNATTSDSLDPHERSVANDLLGALLLDPSLIALVRGSGFSGELLRFGGHRAVFDATIAAASAGEEPDAHTVASRLVDTPYRTLPAELFANAPANCHMAVEKSLRFFLHKQSSVQILELTNRMRDAEVRGDTAELKRLQIEILTARRNTRPRPEPNARNIDNTAGPGDRGQSLDVGRGLAGAEGG
ncbi:MAG: DNA primase [Planctomycetota bacterium]